MKKLVALVLCLIFIGMAVFAQNLVVNPNFSDQEEGRPDIWTTDSYGKKGSVKVVDDGAGGKMLEIQSSEPDHTYAWQEVPVEPGKVYRLSADIKVDDIDGTKAGAYVGIHSKTLYADIKKKTTGFEKASLYINPKGKMLSIMVSLGGYGSENKGKAYYKNVELVEVDPSTLPKDQRITIIEDKGVKSKFDKGWIFIMLIFVLSVGGSLWYLYKKNGKKI